MATDKEIADWLLSTMNLFKVELSTAHKVVGLFLEGINAEACESRIPAQEPRSESSVV